MAPPPKLTLARLPTPLWRHDALDAMVGCELWVKRDDMTAGAAAGNKIRKLEYLLAAALAEGADTVITCGGYQSNHARATAILARELGLACVLLLRSPDPIRARPDRGNAFLDALVGAEIRGITAEQYRERGACMAEVQREVARAGRRAYVIAEGGSSGLGALGYVDAMAEVRVQLDAGEAGAPREFDAVVHACGSGGTAAGVLVGAPRHGIAPRVVAMAVCDDRAYFEPLIERLAGEACALLGSSGARAALQVEEGSRGPAYGVASPEQVRFLIAVARASGLVLDPVYTGKALWGLAQLTDRPRRALFLHTGGLAGLLAQADALSAYF